MMKCDERRKVKVDAGCIDEIDPGYRPSERATNCFAFSTCARKDFTISLAMIKRIGALSIHGENLQFVVIHIGVISYPLNLRHGVSSAGEKAGDVDETIYARFTRNRASNLFQGPSQGIKLVTTRAHNFQNDKFIYRADNFRTPSIAIILNE